MLFVEMLTAEFVPLGDMEEEALSRCVALVAMLACKMFVEG
jgi:hypothetical protein